MPQQTTHSVPKLPMELAAAKLLKMGIKTWLDFKLLSSGEFEGVQRPADVPAHPMVYYKTIKSFDEFIESGRQYLMTEDANLVETEICTLEELKEVVRLNGIDSHRKWMKAVREGILPGYYPTRPDKYYEDWSGWRDFLAPRKRFLDFEEARSKARELAQVYGLSQSKDWRQLSRAKKRPKSLPSNPSEYYDDWISWDDWFGI